MNKHPRTIESTVGAEIVIDGKRYINFGGSSYLGLSTRVDAVAAGMDALRTSGAGYQFPREFGIDTAAHLAAEAAAVSYFDAEAALYFSCGYLMGLIALGASKRHFDQVFMDEWAHYSLRDAVLASGLPCHEFRHLDPEDLESKLLHHLRAKQRPLVITDGLYATFGEIAPLGDFAALLAPYSGHLLVDESHSFGVLGSTGRGACEHHQLHRSVASIGGSTCKALGAVGGLMIGTTAQIAELRATPAGRGASIGMPAAAAMCASSLRYLQAHPELLHRLRRNVSRMKSGLRKLGLPMNDSVAPVATFTAGGDETMHALQACLFAQGIYVFHTSYIGAGAGGVIRCGIFADHTAEQIDRFLDVLGRAL